MRYYYAKQVFSDDYEFQIKSVTSDDSTYIHTHDYIEVEFIVSGTGKYMVDSVEFPLRRGDIYLIDEEHTHCILCDNVSKYFTLYFTKEFLSSIFPFEDRSIDAYTAFFKDMYDPIISFDDEYIVKIESILQNLLAEFSSKKKEYKGYISALLCELFLEMWRTKKQNQIAQSKKNSKVIMPRITDYIDAHCFEPITLTDIAKLYNFNQAYLGRTFKKSIGISFNDYVEEKRMSQIVFLLTTSNLPVDEVIRNAGYTNKTFFFKKFKQRYGCTPSEYRVKYAYVPKEKEE